MPDPVWPSSSEVHAAAAGRAQALLDECGGLVAEYGRQTMSVKQGLLSEHPHSITTVLVPGACIAAGGHWRQALWPAVGAECMMAAADLFDDAADADPSAGDVEKHSPAVLLTVAAGLLSLATVATLRVQSDGADPLTAVALAHLLNASFAAATNGQAANLQSNQHQADAFTAYRQSAAKSGPLGSLIARLGARTATDSADIVNLLGEFGTRLAVRSQLLNDARDAAPDPASLKADVRAGARTIPLAFTGSRGAPAGLSEAELADWERAERQRIASGGGLVAAQAVAEAERLGAVQALDRLERLGCNVSRLRELL